MTLTLRSFTDALTVPPGASLHRTEVLQTPQEGSVLASRCGHMIDRKGLDTPLTHAWAWWDVTAGAHVVLSSRRRRISDGEAEEERTGKQ